MPTVVRRSGLRRSAFTLVELLVVIGIIGLLVSILLPALNRAREQARSVACMSNMKQLLLAFNMYVSEFKGATPIFPPIPGTYNPGAMTGPERSLAYYTDGAGSLRFDVGAFWPFVTTARRPSGTPGAHETTPPPSSIYNVMNCPSDTPPRQGFSPDRNFSYSWNAQLWNISGFGFLPNLDRPSDTHAVSRINHIKEPSHKIILEEEAAPNDGWSVIGLNGGSTADTPAFRHLKYGSWGFADGHVESLLPTDMGYSTVRDYNNTAVVTDPLRLAWYFHLQSNGL